MGGSGHSIWSGKPNLCSLDTAQGTDYIAVIIIIIIIIIIAIIQISKIWKSPTCKLRIREN